MIGHIPVLENYLNVDPISEPNKEDSGVSQQTLLALNSLRKQRLDALIKKRKNNLAYLKVGYISIYLSFIVF